MAGLGLARAAGAAFMMSAWTARNALAAEGGESSVGHEIVITRLRKSVAIWPFDARAWDMLGAFELEADYARAHGVPAGGVERALDAFHQAVKRAPGNPLYWMRLAAARLAAKQDAAAAEALASSICVGPFHPHAMLFRFSLGLRLWKQSPPALRDEIISQGVGMLREGYWAEGAALIRAAPPDLRSTVALRLTGEERARLIGHMLQ